MNKKLGPFGHDVRIHIFLSNTIFSYSVHYFISDPGSFLYETVNNNWQCNEQHSSEIWFYMFTLKFWCIQLITFLVWSISPSLLSTQITVDDFNSPNKVRWHNWNIVSSSKFLLCCNITKCRHPFLCSFWNLKSPSNQKVRWQWWVAFLTLNEIGLIHNILFY